MFSYPLCLGTCVTRSLLFAFFLFIKHWNICDEKVWWEQETFSLFLSVSKLFGAKIGHHFFHSCGVHIWDNLVNIRLFQTQEEISMNLFKFLISVHVPILVQWYNGIWARETIETQPYGVTLFIVFARHLLKENRQLKISFKYRQNKMW